MKLIESVIFPSLNINKLMKDFVFVFPLPMSYKYPVIICMHRIDVPLNQTIITTHIFVMYSSWCEFWVWQWQFLNEGHAPNF